MNQLPKKNVLAVFGEKDSQVNWRNTILFYKENIGLNESSKLTIKTFSNQKTN